MTVPVRRFEPGCTVDYMAEWMEQRGWTVSSHVGRFRVKKNGAKGPGKLVTRGQLLKLFDAERIAEGKEPVQRRAK